MYPFPSALLTAGATGPVAGIVPAFAHVAILLGFNGSDGATSSSDESSNARTLTFVGNAQLDTAQAKFGVSSLLLDGTGDYVSIPGAPELSIQSGVNLTFEGWIRPHGFGGSGNLRCVFAKRRSGNLHIGYALFVQNDGTLEFIALQSGTGNVVDLVSTTALSLDASYAHFAVTRNGTTWALHINGNLERAAVESGTFGVGSDALLIGRDAGNTGRDFNGWIDEFRMTVGEALYPVNANFLVPTAAFPRS